MHPHKPVENEGSPTIRNLSKGDSTTTRPLVFHAPAQALSSLWGLKSMYRLGEKKMKRFLCTQKTKRLIVRGERKKQRASENNDLFSESDANIRSNWRVKSHLRVPWNILLKVQNLISKAYRTNTTLWLSTPHELLPPATLMGHTLLVGVHASF